MRHRSSLLMQGCAFWGFHWKCFHFGALGTENLHCETPDMKSIIKKITNSSKTVQDREKFTIDHLREVGVGRSKSTVGFVVMVTGSGKWPHSSKIITCTFIFRTIQDRPKINLLDHAANYDTVHMETHCTLI